MRLTRTGLGIVAGAVALFVLGWRWGYAEMVAVSIFAIVAVATLWIFSRRPTNVVVTERIVPARATRGSLVACRVLLGAEGPRSAPPVVLVDSLLGERSEVFVAGLRPGERRTVDYTLLASRRGAHVVGPLVLRRDDLLGVVTYERDLGAPAEILVHPRVLTLAGSSGADHVSDSERLVRRATTDPLAGFQSLRDYQRGDDTRTIHWPSTARMGRLMVREYVDARRPQLTIVLDTGDSAHTGEGFEEAVDVAASLGAFALRSGLEVVVRTTDERQRGKPEPLGEECDLLDLLARVRRTDSDETLAFAPLVAVDGPSDSVVIVTGPHGVFPRLASLADRLTVVRIGAVSGTRHPGLVSAPDAEAFQRVWRAGE